MAEPFDAARYKALDWKKTPLEEVPVEARNGLVNRNFDVLPRAKTRVVISGRTPADTYINANYIRGADGSPKRYICAMGPKPETFDAFWKMVLEHKVVSIVMATGLQEGGKPKCSMYWPKPKKTVQYGGITVRSVKVAKGKHFISTELLLRGPNGSEQAVMQYWFNTWPDHGVPKGSNTAGLIAIHKAVRANQAKFGSSAPMVAHCSAGVGRSGSVIAFDYAVDMLRADVSNVAKVDLIKIIDTIRDDRVALVQHKVQCQYVIHAINDFEDEARAASSASAVEGAPGREQHRGGSRKKRGGGGLFGCCCGGSSVAEMNDGAVGLAPEVDFFDP